MLELLYNSYITCVKPKIICNVANYMYYMYSLIDAMVASDIMLLYIVHGVLLLLSIYTTFN